MLGPEGLAFTQEGKRLFRGERGDKSAGTDQGSPDSPALFCIALAPALRRLHEALAGLGGGAWACMDDAYAVGPAEPVFEALADFARSVNDELHMEVCSHKMKAYSRERDLGWLAGGLVGGRSCSLARSAGRSGPEDFVGLTGLTAPALLGWGLRVIVCAWSVSVWVGPC